MLRKTCIASLITFTLSATTHAAILIAPNCLIKNTAVTYQTLSTNKEFSLIKVNDSDLNTLTLEKTKQKKPCGGFVNVTDNYKNEKSIAAHDFLRSSLQSPTIAKDSTYSIHYATTVNTLIKQLNPQNMWSNLTTLSNFNDRYAGSDNGVAAANWLKNQIAAM